MEVRPPSTRPAATWGPSPSGGLGILRDEAEAVRGVGRAEARNSATHCSGRLQAAVCAGKARKTEFENHLRQIQEEATRPRRGADADRTSRRERDHAKRPAVDRAIRLPRRTKGKYQAAEEDAAGQAAQDDRPPHGPDQ